MNIKYDNDESLKEYLEIQHELNPCSTSKNMLKVYNAQTDTVKHILEIIKEWSGIHNDVRDFKKLCSELTEATSFIEFKNRLDTIVTDKQEKQNE